MPDIYAFGSTVTGDFDEGSDTDILAIERPNEDRRFPPDWSVYSQKRLDELFKSGTLFAWHIYLESVPIYLPDGEGYLSKLGRPKEYSEAQRDILTFKNMTTDSLSEIGSETPSWIYEMGIVGVAIRDTGMAASRSLTGEYAFSKNTPYEINCSPPVCPSLYWYLLQCRRATTRGLNASGFSDRRPELMNSASEVLSWFDDVLNRLNEADGEKLSQ